MDKRGKKQGTNMIAGYTLEYSMLKTEDINNLIDEGDFAEITKALSLAKKINDESAIKSIVKAGFYLSDTLGDEPESLLAFFTKNNNIKMMGFILDNGAYVDDDETLISL